jgi:hypothetical protein
MLGCLLVARRREKIADSMVIAVLKVTHHIIIPVCYSKPQATSPILFLLQQTTLKCLIIFLKAHQPLVEQTLAKENRFIKQNEFLPQQQQPQQQQQEQ